MKTNVILFLLILFAPTFIFRSYSSLSAQDYIVIGWNDLGMHCSNKDFDSIVILPPYNNFRAQVIQVGNQHQSPEIINGGISMTYEIPGNTYSVGKTNFWDHEDQLFGIELAENIGLTGAGLTGWMMAGVDHYGVDGVPITPYTDTDLVNEDPFQLVLLKIYDENSTMLASTQSVMPVSNEIGCVSSGCHGSQWDILDEHTDNMGFDPTVLPKLCSSCHADVALGMPGVPGLESLSFVIHDKHKDKTNDCYKCHPGQNTQCFRGVMHDNGMVCADCHGNMQQVSQSINEGRRPWLDEPSCGATACHGPNYAEEPGKLFKDSKGHGGLYCSACHGSTHSILPSTEARDNVQNIALQGYAGTLNKCITCHGYVPSGPGPHGLTAPGKALAFDGVDDYVDVGNNTCFDLNNFLTIEAWIKPDNLSAPYGIFSTRLNNDTQSFQLEVGPASGGSNRLAVSAPGTWVAESNDNVIASNEWTHIAYTRNGPGATHKLYINGVLQTLSTNADYTFNNNSSDKVIGSGTSGGELFPGQIDELRVWSVVRTESEIQVNMHKTMNGDEANLVAYYRFDQLMGTSLNDLTTNDNDGTLVNMNSSDWVNSTAPVPYTSSASGLWENGSSWQTGQKTPLSAWSRVKIKHNITLNSDLDLIELILDTNARLTISPTKRLKVGNR